MWYSGPLLKVFAIELRRCFDLEFLGLSVQSAIDQFCRSLIFLFVRLGEASTASSFAERVGVGRLSRNGLRRWRRSGEAAPWWVFCWKWEVGDSHFGTLVGALVETLRAVA